MDKTEHQGEKGTETDEVGRAGEVRVDGFGLLSGQNGPPDEEQGAQPSRPSWRGPFWRIWAAERPKRTTMRESKELSQADQHGEVRFGGFGQNGPPRESTEHSQADQAGKVRFGGFGLLSGQNGPPEGASQADLAGEVQIGRASCRERV